MHGYIDKFSSERKNSGRTGREACKLPRALLAALRARRGGAPRRGKRQGPWLCMQPGRPLRSQQRTPCWRGCTPGRPAMLAQRPQQAPAWRPPPAAGPPPGAAARCGRGVGLRQGSSAVAAAGHGLAATELDWRCRRRSPPRRKSPPTPPTACRQLRAVQRSPDMAAVLGGAAQYRTGQAAQARPCLSQPSCFHVTGSSDLASLSS